MKIQWLRRDVEHVVYRCFDAAGHLMYVGATNDWPQRSSHHRARTPWWPNITTVIPTTYPNRAEALAAELAAIRAEAPLHNRQGAQ